MLLVLGVMGTVVLASGLVLIVFLVIESPQVKSVEPDPTAEIRLPIHDPVPQEDSIIQIEISSSPEGAEVWESDNLLCSRTPCTIDHPAGERLERDLTFKLKGYKTQEIRMDDPTQHWSPTLPRVRRPTPPPVPSPSTPKPMIEDER